MMDDRILTAEEVTAMVNGLVAEAVAHRRQLARSHEALRKEADRKLVEMRRQWRENVDDLTAQYAEALADANREASFNHEAATRYAEALAAAEGALKQATDAGKG